MKKAKIWIRAFVCIVLSTTFAACSQGTGNQRIDNDDRISLLKQNIPKDYKIPVDFIPKDVSGMCWVELNMSPLEESLKTLADMFGNISSNRNNISIFVQMLQDVRFRYRRISTGVEAMMQEFKCHYKREKWQTEHYFDYVRDFLAAANTKNESPECDSPPCTTTTTTTTTIATATTATTQLISEGPLTSSAKVAGCVSAPDCSTRSERQYNPEDVQTYGLLSLFLISMAANVFFLIWKVKGRRGNSSERSPEIGDHFTRVEEGRLPLDDGISEEKNQLNTIKAI
ncbi:hypothetical protein AAFF_G00061260 [Aldrovandia affinis]|uniref:Kit ligand n=1 Tax=Aldrovandia affinis TaxID=143900 RepID=A0AAD7WEW2_9TELE|nr:hypothetical protein AAFF_G00061260 [Aldrovandia affinis]